MMNIQFIIHEEKVYVIEVNPRASRTVPFLSKVTNIPMAQVATQVILGQSLLDLGYQNGLYPESDLVHVKAPVFSFTKLKSVDSYLGPEMKSTGEVMGSDITLDKALYKAFAASGYTLSDHGNVLFTIDDSNKDEATRLAKRLSHIGFKLFATKGTYTQFVQHGLKVELVSKISETGVHNLLELIESNSFDMVINTMGKDKDQNSDGFIIRHKAIEHGIALFTSLDTASAIIRVLESRSFNTQSL
jgi:carbamoyl-phosphate synthase large subunit